MDHGHRPARGGGGRSRSVQAQGHVGAPAHISDDLADAPRAGALVPGHGLEPRHRFDRPLRHGRQRRRRRSPAISRPGSSTYDYDHSHEARSPAGLRRRRRSIATSSACSELSSRTKEKLRELEAVQGWTGFRRTPHDPRAGGDAAGIRRRDHPDLFQRHCLRYARPASGAVALSAVVVARRLDAGASDLPGTRQLFTLPADGGELKNKLTDLRRARLRLLPAGRARTALGESTRPETGEAAPHPRRRAAGQRSALQPLDAARLARRPAWFTTNRRDGHDLDVIVHDLRERRARLRAGQISSASASISPRSGAGSSRARVTRPPATTTSISSISTRARSRRRRRMRAPLSTG